MTLVLLGILLKDLNIWALEPLDVPVVVPHHPPAVDVVAHPGEVHQSSEHSLKIYVVTKDEPEPKHCLTQAEYWPEDELWQHETSHILPDAPDEEDRGDDERGEHDDAEPARVLSVSMKISLEERKIELWCVTSVHQICNQWWCQQRTWEYWWSYQWDMWWWGHPWQWCRHWWRMILILHLDARSKATNMSSHKYLRSRVSSWWSDMNYFVNVLVFSLKVSNILSTSSSSDQ